MSVSDISALHGALETSPEKQLPPLPTMSLEKCLLPLVLKISSLVTSPNERGGVGGAMTSRAVGRVGQAVNVAVDRFVTVGETIADDNPEIKVDMYEACKEARAAGSAIEKLCETAEASCERPSPGGGMGNPGPVSQEYRATMIRAARCLLSSVTRVLLLADTVVVKQLLLTKDKVTHSLSRLESVTNFTEFVKAFSQFGAEMVELAQLTCDRQTDLKDERRRAQMAAARQVLDRSTMMLLTASKVCMRHPECMTSRENRDTVFCQMRRAMDLIHYVVKDGVLESVSTPGEVRMNGQSPGESPSGLRTRQQGQEDCWDSNHTTYVAIKHLEDSVEMTRVTLCGPAVRERLCLAVETISEKSQDFTDSAYTSHEHRQTILLLTDRIRLELNHLLRVGVSLEQREIASPSDELESAISAVSAATKELKKELQNTALEQASEIVRGFCEESELISALKNAGLATDQERLDEYTDRFLEHIEHIQEVCKLLRHVATTDSLQVAAKYGEINLRIYGPQVVTAAQTLCLYPTSKIAKENVEVFADMWLNLVGDVKSLTKDIGDQILADNKPPEKQVYMSLPRPGKHGTTTKMPKPTKLDQEEQAKLAKSGLDMKMISSEVDQEAEKWEERITQDEDNDIVKRAKNMSSMAFSMYQFTRGEGALKTTQDLFTQGEYFAEEANRLYKVVRQFSYQVPAGPQKKELMEHLDQIPTYVQTLQFTVKNPTVGKAATFTKVDNVIQETKNLMNVISKVVTTCFVCATKFKLKLPERLQLPTMDEVRASGFSNPFGQVQTPSTDIFPSKVPQAFTNVQVPQCTTHASGSPHTFQPHSVLEDTRTSIEANDILKLELGTSSNLDSPTIQFLETQVNLKNPLDIQNTIKTLQILQTRMILQNTKQIEFQQNLEQAIQTLQQLQNSQDLETRQTLISTIQTLESLQTSQHFQSLIALQTKEPLSSSQQTFENGSSSFQIPLFRKDRLKGESKNLSETAKIHNQMLTIDKVKLFHSHLPTEIRDSNLLSSPTLSPDPTANLNPRFTFNLNPSSNLPFTSSNPVQGPKICPNLNPSSSPCLSPNTSRSLCPSLNTSCNSSLNASPTTTYSTNLSHGLNLASNITPSFPATAFQRCLSSANQERGILNSPYSLYYPKYFSTSNPFLNKSSTLQYLDLETSLISPYNTQMSAKCTDDILSYLASNKDKEFNYWSKYDQNMTSEPNLRCTQPSTAPQNARTMHKDLNFYSLSNVS